jgi:hypothetical protein
MRTSFDIKLLVVPERLSMSQLRTFQAGLEAVNRSGAPIEPDLSSTTLTVDGRRSAAWDSAVQHAPHDASWRKVSPDQRLSIWWTLDERLFDGPGRYQLVLKCGDRESVAEVEVTP